MSPTRSAVVSLMVGSYAVMSLMGSTSAAYFYPTADGNATVKPPPPGTVTPPVLSSHPANITLPHPTTKHPVGTSSIPITYTVPTQKTVLSYTVICPSPTTVVEKSETYTATRSGETITVTNCPCVVPATTVLTANKLASETQYKVLTTSTPVVKTTFESSGTITVIGPSTTQVITGVPHQTVELTNGPYKVEKVTPNTHFFTPGPPTHSPTLVPSPAMFIGDAGRVAGSWFAAVLAVMFTCLVH